MNFKWRSLFILFLILSLALPGALNTAPQTAAAAGHLVLINEIRIDQPSTDTDEYFELAGAPGTDLTGLTYLVIGDGTGGSGVIEAVVDLSGSAIPASGFFVAAEDSFTLGSANLVTTLNFENSDNVTHLLVSGFSGSNGQDLDTNNDGILDLTPWTDLLDLIALVEEQNPPGGTEFHYGLPSVGPDGPFVPGHVFRCGSDWEIGAFGGGDDTPGAVNPCPILINEIRIDQPGSDDDEYFELSGAIGASLDGLTYLVIGDGTGGSGVIEAVVDLSGSTIPGSGLFVAAESTFTLGSADLVANLNFENGDNVTHLLVSGFSGSLGQDLDTDDDGVLDEMPWSEQLDLIALVEEENPPTGTEFHYGPPSVGPDGTFVPGHVFRCGEDWEIGPFSDFQDTPGNPNPCVVTIPLLPIGSVQGVVTDADSGTAHTSPFVGQRVKVQGVIYELTQFISGGRTRNGFFIQNTAETADGDPLTSDGIFVFMSDNIDLIGGYVPQEGDEVIIEGTVTEFFNLTQLTSASLDLLVRSNVDIDAELPPFEANPPADLDEANRYWERREGMRAQVPADSIVLSGRDVFASTLDAEVWVARGDTEIAQRADPYARRAFRDAHPLDDIDDTVLFDNGNGYRIVMGSHGLKAALDDVTAMLAPARTFDTMTNAPTGGVYFSFSKYQIQVTDQLDLFPGVDPAKNAPPQAFPRDQEYSVVTFNVENLYDFRDDPFDGCDFTGNDGCPGVRPPFDYVPASDAVYQARLLEIAQQIVDDLHNPDVILAQEAEDQDICTTVDMELVCPMDNNVDGKPDTLQELATVIYDLSGIWYEAAYDRDGADDRGIVSAYLFRSDRAELLSVSADHPVLGSDPQIEYRGEALPFNMDVQNPKALNAVLPEDVDRSTGTDGDNVFTRSPQVALFRLWRDGFGASVFTDVYMSDNHFSSGPDRRVGQRTEQALYNAAIVEALQEAFGETPVLVGGDLNVFPRPDDPFRPGDPLFPSDQLAPLYEQGLTNLYDHLVMEVPASAYSYTFQGQAQTLDQIFATGAAMDDFIQMRAAHINADWPAEFDGDGPRGTSDHDPQAARFSVLPTAQRLMMLVQYFADQGAITGRNTDKNIIGHLEKAQRFLENGQTAAYQAQLQAFINQVQGFSPRFIDPFAADVLVSETMLLLQLP